MSTPRLFHDEHDTFVAERSIDVMELEAFAASSDAVTREGAALGLHALRERITKTLERLAASDPSPGVRATAANL